MLISLTKYRTKTHASRSNAQLPLQKDDTQKVLIILHHVTSSQKVI